MGGRRALRGAARLTDPESGYLVTANNRIAGDDYPHHITSDWLDGYRAQRIEQLLEATEEHDLEDFERIQADVHSIPGAEAAQRLGRLRPRTQRERQAIERLRSWDGRMAPDSIAASICQAFVLRLAREVARAAIGDRDLSERWLDRSDSGFTAHVTSPWRWHSHLLALWAEGDDSLIGRPWEELVLDALRGGLDDLEDRFGRDPEGWEWGRVHEMEFTHALGGANPLFARLLNRRLRAGGAQETVSQIAYDPVIPTRRSGRRAGAWSPTRRTRTAPAGRCSPASPAIPEAATTTTCSRTGCTAAPSRWPVRDPGRSWRLSRREQIRLSEEEVRELLGSERVVIATSNGPRGWPHSMPLWYVPREGEVWIWTYAKSQKARNLERDPRATLLIETGHEYTELRGVMIEAEAVLHREFETVLAFAEELTVRYAEGISSVEGDAKAALEAQAPKRVAIQFRPLRTATWDHRKLGGVY